jgi:hypothetical protein
MYPYTKRELDAFVLLETSMQGSHGIENTEPSTDSPVGIVFMRVGIAKVHQETIPQELSNVPVIASNYLSTGGLIRTDYLSVLFWVELAGQFCGIDQVTEHDGQLTSFCFWWMGLCWYKDCLSSWSLFNN